MSVLDSFFHMNLEKKKENGKYDLHYEDQIKQNIIGSHLTSRFHSCGIHIK
mgnify:CR=1 FL=1